jgi:hypothetical protein
VTIVLLATSFVAAVAVAVGGANVAAASVARTRVQAAADAAALAAIATSVPGRTGDPEASAGRFARLNGAKLVYCWCLPGDTAMQVRVESDAMVATARAVFDPSLLRPADFAFGLHPELRAALRVLLRHSDGALSVTSGWRSAEQQAALWSDALARYGSPEAADDWVARPGTSAHERGVAVDLAGDLDLAMDLIRWLRLPLERPLANEPWHFELVG